MDFNQQYNSWVREFGTSNTEIFFAGKERLAMPLLPAGEIARLWSNDIPFLGIFTRGGPLFAQFTSRITPKTPRMREHMKKKDWYAFFARTEVTNSSLLVWRNFIGKADANLASLLKDMAETTVRLNGHAATDSRQRFLSQLYLLDRQIQEWNGSRAATVPVHSEQGGITGWNIFTDSVLDAPRVFGDAAGQFGGAVGNVTGETLGSAVGGFTDRLGSSGFLLLGVGAVVAYLFVVK